MDACDIIHKQYSSTHAEFQLYSSTRIYVNTYIHDSNIILEVLRTRYFVALTGCIGGQCQKKVHKILYSYVQQSGRYKVRVVQYYIPRIYCVGPTGEECQKVHEI